LQFANFGQLLSLSHISTIFHMVCMSTSRVSYCHIQSLLRRSLYNIIGLNRWIVIEVYCYPVKDNSISQVSGRSHTTLGGLHAVFFYINVTFYNK